LGYPLDEETAARAGKATVEEAMPLSENSYKMQLAKVSVQRAILRAAGSYT
jgi:CO/xanthine dehydrogenase FAD-binding subunit